jgi:hypothetical protein
MSLASSSPLLAFFSLLQPSPLTSSSSHPLHLAIEWELEVIGPVRTTLEEDPGPDLVASSLREEEALCAVSP